MRILHIFLGLCFATTMPQVALAQAAGPDKGHTSLAQVDAGLKDFGEWFARFSAVEAPVLAATLELGPKWQQAMALGTPDAMMTSFRPVLTRLRAAIAQANVGLAALDTPEFVGMPLPADLKPKALIAHQLEVNRQIGALADGYENLLGAFERRDEAAGMQAMTTMIGGLDVLLDSQVVMIRVTQTMERPNSAVYSAAEVRISILKAMQMLVAAMPIHSTPKVDIALATRLAGFAAAIDADAIEGIGRADAEIAMLSKARDEGTASGDAARVSLASRAIRLLALERQLFGIGQRCAALFRSAAADFRKQPATVRRVVALITQWVPIRDELHRIESEEAVAFAGD
jgi:hypothetical protein